MTGDPTSLELATVVPLDYKRIWTKRYCLRASAGVVFVELWCPV
jgi:hypothetical protein